MQITGMGTDPGMTWPRPPETFPIIFGTHICEDDEVKDKRLPAGREYQIEKGLYVVGRQAKGSLREAL